MIDLHTHTTHSDGSLSPEKLTELAAHSGIKVLAVTDHDEVSGFAEAHLRGRELGVKVIAGVELSIDYDLSYRGHLHLLGLFIEVEAPPLRSHLDRLRLARRERAIEIINKLRGQDIEITGEEEKQILKKNSIGRPHIAGLLIRRGIVGNIAQAFNKYLKKGAPAYVPKVKLPVEQAVELIHQSGGMAVMAHPVSLGFGDYPRLGKEILKLKNIGLDGIEAYYPSQDHYMTKWLLEFAQKNGLAVSGGSDFHGAPKPDIRLGVGRGDLNVPDSVFDALERFHKNMISNVAL